MLIRHASVVALADVLPRCACCGVGPDRPKVLSEDW